MRHILSFQAMAFVLLILISSVLQAEETHVLGLEGGANALIFSIDEASISYDDQVTDGCLPNPSRLRDSMEVSLRKAGLKIKESTLVGGDINITTVGYKHGAFCVVSFNVVMNTWRSVVVPFAVSENDSQTLGPITIIVDSGILSGSATHVQSSLENSAGKAGDKVFLLISRARDQMKENFPEIYAEYLRYGHE